MAKINEAIEYEIALFDQKLWLTRRAWQFAVHGSVQAALTAALTRMQDPNLSDTELLVLVQSDLERAIKALPVALQRQARRVRVKGKYAFTLGRRIYGPWLEAAGRNEAERVLERRGHRAGGCERGGEGWKKRSSCC